MRARLEPAFDRFDGEDEHPEPAFLGQLGIQLAEPAGGRVAGVGEGLLAFFFPFLVDPGEAGVGHVHLAPDLHHFGVIVPFK